MSSSTVDLGGLWRALPADEELRRAFPSPHLDDASWLEVAVPGHWRSSPELCDSNGPLLYRRRFEAPRSSECPERDRWWLVLEGLFYQGDVWLDGTYLGDTEGYFVPHSFELTDALRQPGSHLLALEVTCNPPSDRRAKRNLTGVFQHWDCLDPDWNPGGIWRPVRLQRSGPVRIGRLRFLCREANEERATLQLRASLDAARPTGVRVRTTVGEQRHEAEHPLARGENRLAWSAVIEQPRLWWPHSLGPQHLVDVSVEVMTEDGELSDRRSFRSGLRQVRMDRWVMRVNGERLFLKGSNYGPTRMDLAEATQAEVTADVETARQAGLDLLRVHGHIGRPELYQAADEAGLLLWQDLPLQWGYARGVRKQAARQAREAVDLLGLHPSIAIWCGHSQPFALDLRPGHDFDGRHKAKMLALQELPSWNKSILDHSVHRALEKADSTRPSIAHSGLLPSLGSRGTDAHLYFGWYWGHERDLPGFLAAWPRIGRFVSEFGAQALPTNASFMAPKDWPELDWGELERRHGTQLSVMARHGLAPDGFATFEEWQAATQAYQATLIRHYVETLRRLKYRPTGGFCQFLFADSHPAVSCSVLGHDRAPKPGYAALVAACAPLIVVADRMPPTYEPGDSLALDVHVVSDLRRPLYDAAVTARLCWRGGGRQWRWAGVVTADACVRVGQLQTVLPDAEGPLALELELSHPEAGATNRYQSLILR